MSRQFDYFKNIVKENMQVFMKRGDYSKLPIDLNDLSRPAISMILRFYRGSMEHFPRLTEEQRKAFDEMWSKYFYYVSDNYHRILSASSGVFHKHYIPEDVMLGYVDEYLSDRELAKYLDNKCYYYRLFPDIKQPECVCMRIGNTWLNREHAPITKKDAYMLMRATDEAVVKIATASEGGHGVSFVKGRELDVNTFKMLMSDQRDIVVQRAIRQHPDMAMLHPESINTLRIVSLLTENKIKICGVCQRIGVGTARFDNNSSGGIFTGVKADGYLTEYGIQGSTNIIYTHPTLGYSFSDMRIPHVDKAIELVRKAHPFFGHFRLISWDIAIDENGEAVLIEANFSMGKMDTFQACVGPLFGSEEETRQILDDVFKGKKRIAPFI